MNSIPFIHNNNELKKACELNLKKCILENTIPFNWNFGLYGACLSNNEILINNMIDLGAKDFNWAFRGLSQNGDIEFIKKMEILFNQLNKDNNLNYDWALSGACLGNNIEAVKYYLKKNIEDINSAIRITCEQGHLEIFDFLFKEKKEQIDFTLALAAACLGHRNIKNYPMDIIIICCNNLKGKYFDCALYEASWTGIEEIINSIISKMKSLNIKINKIHLIRGATLGNQKNILKKFIKGKNLINLIKIGYYEAAYSGNKEIIQWYELNYKIKDDINFLTGLCQSNRKIDLFDLIRINKDILCLWCNKIHNQ